MRILLLLFVLAAAARGSAQQIGQNKTPGAREPTPSPSRSQLVVEAVVVKDKQGKFIQGLTAKDFTLTEDGVPQTIRFCEQQKLAANAEPLPAPAAGHGRHENLQATYPHPDCARGGGKRPL